LQGKTSAAREHNCCICNGCVASCDSYAAIRRRTEIVMQKFSRHDAGGGVERKPDRPPKVMVIVMNFMKWLAVNGLNFFHNHLLRC